MNQASPDNYRIELTENGSAGTDFPPKLPPKRKRRRRISALSLLVDDEAAAELLGISEREVWRMHKAGTMPDKVGIAGTKWSRNELIEWVLEGCPDLTNDRLRYRKHHAVD